MKLVDGDQGKTNDRRCRQNNQPPPRDVHLFVHDSNEGNDVDGVQAGSEKREESYVRLTYISIVRKKTTLLVISKMKGPNEP